MKKFLKLASIIAFACAGNIAGRAQSYPQLTDVPTVYIVTENNQPITSKEDYVNATLRYVDASGEQYYDALGIRGRGNSTWGMAKKPYRIKFDKKQTFLGKDHAKAKSWTLLANYADKTLIRNAVASEAARFAGQPFAASAQFVDLMLNGQYLGCYQISDQMEVREKRVDITEQDKADDGVADITGGYFLEVDGFATEEPVYITTNHGVLITIKSPDDEIISQRQINYIRDHINKFENALFSDSFTDSEKGYRKYVDAETLASWYVASELTGNPDVFWSTYIYKEKGDDRIYWGPMWDYDIAFNNCDRVGSVTRELMINKGFGADLTMLWVKRMWQDPWFVNLVNDKWKELVAKGIEQHLLDYIDATASMLERSQQMNFAKWPINRHDYNELVLFSTYAEGIAYLKQFITGHCAYLTEVFQLAADGSSLAPVPTMEFIPDESCYYTISNIGTGLYIDAQDANAVVNGRRNDSYSQHYFIEAAYNGYVRIINRESGLALADKAAYVNGQYQTGSQVAFAQVNAADQAQLWKVEALEYNNRYLLVNKLTNLACNNNGGGTADGTAVISWTNDWQNADKPNRQWSVMRSEKKPSAGIDGVEADEYMITYSPAEGVVRFFCDGELPQGTVAIFDAAGRTALSCGISPEINISHLPAGLYIISWNINGKQRTAKLMR